MEKGKIFISYRQSDTQSEASRLKEDLEEVFGEKNVFFDIETLEPGLNFADAIEKTIRQSKVVLVLIGPNWADVKDDEGNLRLFNENDWVRREVAMALSMKDVRVIPVLIKKAVLPSADQLPDNIKELAGKHWKEITISRWRYDVGVLIKSLEQVIPPIKKPDPEPAPRPRPVPKPKKGWWAKNYLWVLLVFVAIILIGLIPDEENYGDDYVLPITESGLDQQTQQPQNLGQTANISVKGSWILYLNGQQVSTLIMSHYPDQIEFLEYNALNINIGSGSGEIEANEMFLDYYNSVMNLSGEMYLTTQNAGSSWEGTISFSSTGVTNNIALRRN